MNNKYVNYNFKFEENYSISSVTKDFNFEIFGTPKMQLTTPNTNLN